MDADIKKAIGRVDRSLTEWGICQAQWQTIRTRLIELEALLADYENANRHSADDCVAKDVEITRLQSRLAAADALLRECYGFMQSQSIDQRSWGEALSLGEKIEAHLHNSAREDGE